MTGAGVEGKYEVRVVNVASDTYWRGAEAWYAGEVRGCVLVICGLWLGVGLLLRLPVLKPLGIHGDGGEGLREGWEERGEN